LIIPSYEVYTEFKRPEFMREVNSTGVWNDTLPEAPRQLASAEEKKIEAEAIEIVNRGIVYVN
jgi:hypothetical protein